MGMGLQQKLHPSQEWLSNESSPLATAVIGFEEVSHHIGILQGVCFAAVPPSHAILGEEPSRQHENEGQAHGNRRIVEISEGDRIGGRQNEDSLHRTNKWWCHLKDVCTSLWNSNCQCR